MANIRKTFNFRNGVQVDDDNVVVDSLGKVGIGTSVPTEFLDVRGVAKIVGVLTATKVYTNEIVVGMSTIGTLGIGSFDGGIRVGVVSITPTGIITASSGVVTYYGDGGSLLNLPTSQWLDINIGLGFTSIYAQGFVGVNTTSPFYPFQVGGTDQTRTFADVGATGVGIDSTGNIYSTGIVTASTYYGSGSPLQNLNASNITGGILNNGRLPSNIQVSGIVTAQSGFSGNLTGTVTGTLTGIAQTADSLTLGIGISVGIATATLARVGFASVGILTVTSLLHTLDAVGIKTQQPNATLHVFSNTGASLRVQSGSDQAIIDVGNSDENRGEISFGNLTRAYSNSRSLDICNFDTGAINNYIQEGNAAGINTGNFNWLFGKDDSVLMSLSYEGNLGIGITLPQQRLHVSGIATFTNNVFVGNSLKVKNALDVYGTATFENISVTSLTAPLFNGNVYSDSGISTFKSIDIKENFSVGNLGIGTTNVTAKLVVYDSVNQRNALSVAGNQIGILTAASSSYPSVDINALSASVLFNIIGIGTTRPAAAVDFAYAGISSNPLGFAGGKKRYMLLPRLTTAQRNDLSMIEPTDSTGGAGAIIYNLSTKTIQGYEGSPDNLSLGNWYNLFFPGSNASYSNLTIAAPGGVQVGGLSTISSLRTRLAVGTASSAPIIFTSGTNLTTAEAGALEYDGSFFYATPDTTSGRGQIVTQRTFRLTSNGSNIGSAIADFFSSSSSINLVASSVYKIKFHAYFTKNTAGTATWTLTASSAPTLISGYYTGSPVTGIGAGTPITGYTGSQGSATAAFGATGSLTNGVNHSYVFEVEVVTNAATTFRLQLTQSTGTATPLAGSYYTVERISTSAGTFS